jgi:hypothetical protein
MNTQQEYDKEFYDLVGDEEWVAPYFYRKWFKGNYTRLRRLAIAMEKGEIGFCYLYGGKEHPQNVVLHYVKKSEYSRGDLVEYTKASPSKRSSVLGQYIGTSDIANLQASDRPIILLAAVSLLKWLNKNYPLEPDPVSINDLPFMSDRLSLAIDISKKLYPDGYTITYDRKKYNIEKHRIDAELDKDKIIGDLKTWMCKIITPERWKK